MRRMQARTHGFTLVEVMIVVAVIGLIAAIAIPSFISARQASQKKACIENLQLIAEAKERWAAAQNKEAGDAVIETEVNVYIKGDAPKCPAGGKYTYGPIGTDPVCNHKEGRYPHKLP